MSEQPAGLSGSLLDGVIRFGKEFGAIALILAFFLGQDAGWINNPTVNELKEIKQEIQQVKGQVIQHDATMKELTKAVESQGEQLEEEAKKRQMRCVLRAKTEEEKKACFPKGKE